MATGCCWPSPCSSAAAVSTALFMLLSSCAGHSPRSPSIRAVPRGPTARRMRRAQLPQIKECEDEYPHQVHEMPIQAGDLHGLITPLAVIKSPPDSAGYDSQINHARRD